MSGVRSVYYTKEQRDIVESGIDAIGMVLYGVDTVEKERLLLCLDRYLDPYYGYNLPYADEIFMMLQKLLFESNNIEVKEDMLDLLDYYSTIPLEYLKKHIDAIEPVLLSRAKEVLDGMADIIEKKNNEQK